MILGPSYVLRKLVVRDFLLFLDYVTLSSPGPNVLIFGANFKKWGCFGILLTCLTQPWSNFSSVPLVRWQKLELHLEKWKKLASCVAF